MTIEIKSVHIIDMYETLTEAEMWAVREGFINGYVDTEIAVDRLHVLIHEELPALIN
jgi:hypothetical protein